MTHGRVIKSTYFQSVVGNPLDTGLVHSLHFIISVEAVSQRNHPLSASVEAISQRNSSASVEAVSQRNHPLSARVEAVSQLSLIRI